MSEEHTPLKTRLRSERHLTQGDGLGALLDTAAEALARIEALEAALRPFAEEWAENEYHSQCHYTDYLNAARTLLEKRD